MTKSLFLLIVFFFVFSASTLFANNPAHNANGIKSTTVTPIGSSPLVGGIVILTSLSIGYGASRIYRMRREYQEILS